MKKYNMSNIMTSAWTTYNKFKCCVCPLSFAECLRRAWAAAKKAAVVTESINREIGKSINGFVVYMSKGVIAEAGRMGWVLSGKTYPVRKDIKAMGFKFDCEARNWYTEDRNVAIAFANRF